MDWPRLRGPALGVGHEMIRGYIFIAECIRHCYYDLMGWDELPSRYIVISVVLGREVQCFPIMFDLFSSTPQSYARRVDRGTR
jgi:hypothetical protein